MTRFLDRNNPKLDSNNSNNINANTKNKNQINLEANGIESPIFINNNLNSKENEKRFVFEDDITQINCNINTNNEQINRQTITVTLTTLLNHNDLSKTPQVNPNEKQARRGFMNKQEKAFKQLSAIVFGFTLCFLPYFIVFMIVAICEDWSVYNSISFLYFIKIFTHYYLFC